MKKYVLFAVLLLAIVALAGCGSQSTSSGSSTDPIIVAAAADPSLFDVGTSDASGNVGISTVPSTSEVRCHSWYRQFISLSDTTFTIISTESTYATVEANRTASGILYATMESSSSLTSEAFQQYFTRFITLVSNNNKWKIKSVTQGLSKSTANTSGSINSSPFKSMASDVYITSVTITAEPSGQTYSITQDPSSETGPWIDHENILTVEAGDTLEVTVVANETGNTGGLDPYVFIWPNMDEVGFFRHQLTPQHDHQVTYTISIPTIPSGLDNTRRKSMIIGVFGDGTLTSTEATLGAYDFTSWHIPYKVKGAQ
jgi:hypothetical protein